jgi:hypothetical protein
MELDANIKDREFPDDAKRVKIDGELVSQEDILYKEESLTLPSALFDKYLKKKNLNE